MILYQVGEIFQIYFHAWCLVKRGSIFSKWVASCFNTMFWKDYSLPPLNYSGTFAENKLTVYLCADFWTFQPSALMYLSLCQYNIILFTAVIFMFDHIPLPISLRFSWFFFLYWFHNHLVYFYKNSSGIFLELCWIYRKILRSWRIFNIYSMSMVCLSKCLSLL